MSDKMKQSDKIIKALQEMRMHTEYKMDPLRKESSKQSVFRAIFELGAQTQNASMPLRDVFWQLKYVMPVLAGILFVGSTVFAAANSAKPGDTFYAIKKVTQAIELKLAITDTQKVKIQVQIAQNLISDYHEIQSEPASAPKKDVAVFQAKSELANSLSSLSTTQASLNAKGDNDNAQQVASAINDIKSKTKIACPAAIENSACGVETQNGGSNNDNGSSISNNTQGVVVRKQPQQEPIVKPPIIAVPPISQGSVRTITLSQNGSSISMNVGDQFILNLGSEDWRVSISNDNVLNSAQDPATELLAIGVQGKYQAYQKGTVVLTATKGGSEVGAQIHFTLAVIVN